MGPHFRKIVARFKFQQCKIQQARPEKLRQARWVLNRQSLLVTTRLSNLAFHLQPIWLQTFGFNRFRIMPDNVSKFMRFAIWSRCAVLFESEQMPFSLTGLQFRSASLHKFDWEHAVLFLCHIFTQTPMNDRKMEWSDEQSFGGQQLLANSIENFISHSK